MALTKVFLTLKIYPGFSTRDERVVYTAGLKQDGAWIRIKPIRFERRNYAEQYRKYDWIAIDIVRDKNDKRYESYRPKQRGIPFRVLESIGNENNWEFRKKIVLQNVYVGMNRLISDSQNEDEPVSLATFKPTRIVDFFWEPVRSSWTSTQLNRLQKQNILEKRDGKLDVIRKLPYRFSYIFEDINGNETTLLVDDWEIGCFFWESLRHRNGNEEEALIDVKNHYFREFIRDYDVYFFLNTTKISHFHAANPFFIAGTFYPRKEKQLTLDFGF